MPVISPEERQALDALDVARMDMEPAEPDLVGRSDTGEAFGYLSAAKLEELATRALERNGVEVDLDGVEVVGGVISTRWSWRCGAWRSTSTTIQLPMIDMGAAGHVTWAKKIFLKALLRVQVAGDPEADLANASDKARDVVFDATRELLRAYCRREGRDESMVIEASIGFRAQKGVATTIEMLPSQHVAMLYARLLLSIGPDVSVAWEPGRAPDGIEELPESMGGPA